MIEHAALEGSVSLVFASQQLNEVFSPNTVQN